MSEFARFYYLPKEINDKLTLTKKIYIFSGYDNVVNYYKNSGNINGGGNNAMGYIVVNLDASIITVYNLYNEEQYTYPVLKSIENGVDNGNNNVINSYTSVSTSDVNDITIKTPIKASLYPINSVSPTQIIEIVLSSS